MMKINKILTTAAVVSGLILTQTGCNEERDQLQEELATDTSFSEPVEIPMPAKSKYAEKRKFADFTCDGIEDMVEVYDVHQNSITSAQDYRANIFPGKIVEHETEGKLLGFEEESFTIKLPLKKNRHSAQVKIDSGDPNGDGCADFIFTEERGIGGDVRYITKVALNNGDGKDYTFIKRAGGKGARSLENLLGHISYRYHDRGGGAYGTKIDWCDGDGNGTDDLMIFKDRGTDLDVHVFYTQADNQDGFTFSGYGFQFVPDILYSTSVTALDTEDINNDNICDIIMYMDPNGKHIRIPTALGVLNREQEYLDFEPQKDHVGVGADYDWTGFEKRDSFDGNFDGCADYVHLGEKNGTPSMTYKFTQHPNCGNKVNEEAQTQTTLPKVKAYTGGWEMFDRF